MLLKNNKMEEENIEEEEKKKIFPECQLGKEENRKRGDCIYCSNRINGERNRTYWICLSCDVFVCSNCSFTHLCESLNKSKKRLIKKYMT